MSLASLLLAVSGLLAGDEVPPLPAPLAWLEDQDDHPLVSRRLMLREAGGTAPRVLLEPLLYSFDAWDNQALGWLGDQVVVSGAVLRSRPAPNLPIPLHVVPTKGGPRDTVPGITPERWVPSPDGSSILTVDLTRLRLVTFGALGPVVHPLLDRDHHLESGQLRCAVWSPDGSAALVSVKERQASLAEGLWRIPLQVDGEGSLALGTLEHLGREPAWPRQVLDDGSVLATARMEREKYTAHEAMRYWPGTDRRPEILTQDLHWNEAAAAMPGPWRAGAPLVLAFVRFSDGALVLRTDEERVLWAGDHAPDSLGWSPDGRWLAFHAQDAQRRPWIHVLEVPTGRSFRVAPGLRPAWGPAARLGSLGDLGVLTLRATADGSLRSVPGPEALTSPASCALDPALLTLSVKRTEAGMVCARERETEPIKFLTFQRAGAEAAYGVYALGGAKNPIEVDLPLHGDPIAWPDRDHAEGLAVLLAQAGLEPDRARDVVASHAERWFREGLRVLLVLPLRDTAAVPGASFDPRWRALLILVELE